MTDLIKLPSFEWFLGLMGFGGKGNTYAGSYGTDPYLGCLGRPSFRYRAWIEKDENDEKQFKAVHYTGNDCYDETDKEKVTEKIFEASAAGILEAQEWLLSELEQFMASSREVQQ